MALWQTNDQRLELLKTIVSYDSVTNSQGEKEFPHRLKELLYQIPYFNERQNAVQLIDAEGKQALTALYRTEVTNDTVVLLSHYDTVDTTDFGEAQSIAADMDALTDYYKQTETSGPISADIASGEYMFGRGAMDMKAGLMIHLAVIEKAVIEEWPVNLLLLTVPDEEVGSSGMRYAVDYLAGFVEQEQLNIRLFLNGEPTFSQHPEDDQHYFYTGSIGKVLTGVYIHGRETHVGEPLNGLSSNYLMSQINRNIEYNSIFTEQYKKEQTPLPVNLFMKDFKEQYDVQTPFISAAYYNLFVFRRSAEEAYQMFHKQVALSMSEVKRSLHHLYDDRLQIKVMKYSELVSYVAARHPKEVINQIINHEAHDYLTDCHHIIGQLINLEPALSPVVVTYVAPPYYPSVNNSSHPEIKAVVKYVKRQMKQHYRPSRRIHFFNGISDLSYVSYRHGAGDEQTFSLNSPIPSTRYYMPFEAMRMLKAPVLNIGPLGKDAHQKTERIHVRSAVEEIPAVYCSLIRQFYM